MKEWKNSVREAKVPVEQRRYLEGVSSSVRKRWRYTRRWKGLTHLGDQWGPGVGLICEVGGAAARRVYDFMTAAGVWDTADPAVHFKQLTGTVLKYGPLVSPDWGWMMHWDQLGGHAELGTEEQFFEEVKDWVGVARKHYLSGSHSRFLECFRLGVREFLSHGLGGLESGGLTLDQFVADPGYWGGAGASSVKVADRKSVV